MGDLDLVGKECTSDIPDYKSTRRTEQGETAAILIYNIPLPRNVATFDGLGLGRDGTGLGQHQSIALTSLTDIDQLKLSYPIRTAP